MGTGPCNCVTLRAKVRLAIAVLELAIDTFEKFQPDEGSRYHDVWMKAEQAIIELKNETGVKSLCPACQDPADHKVHTCGL